jgi:hypothetical protein
MGRFVGVVEGVVSLPGGAQGPFGAPAAAVEARGPSRSWGESWGHPTVVGLACRDVIDEVCRRMARRGYRWE